MDEHGQKVAQTAAALGVEPQAFVDAVARRFRDTWDRLGISYDQFIRTTDPEHKSGVRALIKRMVDSSPDDFYEKTYEGWYCVGCELFKRDDEIVDGKCVLHPTRELQWTQERNWFFRLTKYQPFLERLLAERPEFLQPESRRNEILGLLAQGLEDISITRSKLAWAIPFPVASGNGEQQGTWVWFDALPNYLTATGYPEKRWRSRWPAQLHVVGKDITRLHCVIWPAMLQSAELPLPERVWAHGFISFGGERFSKSAGVKIGLDETIARFGPDAFRYFLLREIPFDGDGTFSVERFDAVYTSELANGLGNLASRVIAMVEKYCAGVVPDSNVRIELDALDCRRPGRRPFSHGRVARISLPRGARVHRPAHRARQPAHPADAAVGAGEGPRQPREARGDARGAGALAGAPGGLSRARSCRERRRRSGASSGRRARHRRRSSRPSSR